MQQLHFVIHSCSVCVKKQNLLFNVPKDRFKLLQVLIFNWYCIFIAK